MKPRELRHNQTKQVILKSSLKLILQDGLQKFSLRKLAQQVNYSPAALYEFFENKDAILTELNRHGFNLLAKDLRSLPKTKPGLSNLTKLGKAYLQFAAKNADLYRFMFSHYPSSKQTLEQLAEEDESFGILYAEMDRFIASDESNSADRQQIVTSLSYSYWSYLHGLSILPITIIKKYDADFEKIHAEALEIFLAGLASSKAV